MSPFRTGIHSNTNENYCMQMLQPITHIFLTMHTLLAYYHPYQVVLPKHEHLTFYCGTPIRVLIVPVSILFGGWGGEDWPKGHL